MEKRIAKKYWRSKLYIGVTDEDGLNNLQSIKRWHVKEISEKEYKRWIFIKRIIIFLIILPMLVLWMVYILSDLIRSVCATIFNKIFKFIEN